MTIRNGFLTVFLAAIGLLVTALPAAACSCLEGDPRDNFAEAEAAVIGEYVGQRPSEDDEYEAIYTIQIDEEWKVDFGETLDVYSAPNGAACGIEAQIGQAIGLFLYMQGDEWHSSLCSQTSPQEMREAASPLPEPTGEGATRAVVGGSFGEARVLSLDGDTETLDYGFGGDHDVSLLDPCPGGRRFIELYDDSRTSEERDRALVVREVSDLSIVRETSLALGAAKIVNRIDCRDANASKSLLFVTPAYGEPDGAIYRETEDGLTLRFDNLAARSAEFGRRHAYLSGAEDRVWQMRLDGSSARVLYSVNRERALSPPALSPVGDHLALIAHGTYEPRRPGKLVLIDLDTGRVMTERLDRGTGDGGVVVWDGARRFLFLSGDGSPIYNLRFERLGGVGRAYVTSADVIGGEVWALTYGGELFTADLPDGTLERQRRLPSPIAYSLIAIPSH